MADERPVTILVVDDNPASRYATARILTAAGFKVLEAATGGEALELATRGPDAVVLDVNLPDMDGFEVCAKLRARDATARIPIIHLSATFVADIDKVHGLEAGADGYLTHPVEPPVLIATVNAFLRARQAEEATRRSEARFRAVFDQALHGIVLLSQDLIYLEVNPAMCRILGRLREEIVGKASSAFVPSGREEEVAAISKSLESQGIWHGILPLLHADGRQLELAWSISIHSVPGVRLAIVSDVTEQKLADAERERLLASERAARTEAERANRLKDDFLATLSHELRTPLNAILGWSQLLSRGGHDDPASVREGIEAITRNAHALTQLISDLLDVSRITSGKLRLELRLVDPAATIDAALETVMPAAQAKGIRIERLLSRDTGSIAADPARLQQVIWNLVNNAVKFTPRGGRITVRLRRADTHVQVTVSDNGEGINATFLPYLFERFRQENATPKRNYGGLGLGLAIVKHLVEMHGGTVSAESEGEGKGSTFTLLMPITALPHSEQTPQGIPPPPSPSIPDKIAFKPGHLKGMRVLVVDDDLDARVLVKRLLVEFGAEVAEATTVPQAMTVLQEFRPHILISDIGMPAQDGYDLIRLIRAQGYSPQKLPAVALTAFARNEDREQAIERGFQVHLAKPVAPNDLLSAISNFLPAR